MNKYQRALNKIGNMTTLNFLTIKERDFTKREFDLLQELVDKETPYIPTEIEHLSKIFSTGKCKCNYRVDNYDTRCEECNQLLKWDDMDD